MRTSLGRCFVFERCSKKLFLDIFDGFIVCELLIIVVEIEGAEGAALGAGPADHPLSSYLGIQIFAVGAEAEDIEFLALSDFSEVFNLVGRFAELRGIVEPADEVALREVFGGRAFRREEFFETVLLEQMVGQVCILHIVRESFNNAQGRFTTKGEERCDGIESNVGIADPERLVQGIDEAFLAEIAADIADQLQIGLRVNGERIFEVSSHFGGDVLAENITGFDGQAQDLALIVEEPLIELALMIFLLGKSRHGDEVFDIFGIVILFGEDIVDHDLEESFLFHYADKSVHGIELVFGDLGSGRMASHDRAEQTILIFKKKILFLIALRCRDENGQLLDLTEKKIGKFGLGFVGELDLFVRQILYQKVQKSGLVGEFFCFADRFNGFFQD